MINLNYDSKYDNPSWDKTKELIKSRIDTFFLNNFNSYSNLNITINMLPSTTFQELNCVANANPAERSIKMNFDTFNKYIKNLKKHNYKLLTSTIKKEHSHIYNTLYHETQHIINHVIYKDAFDYIDNLKSYGYVKAGISNILDEYLASYYSQKKYFSSYGSLYEDLDFYCGKKNSLIKANDQFSLIDLYTDIFTALAYFIAECKVLNEKDSKTNDFNRLLKLKNVQPFSDIFNNIKISLENFTLENHQEYAQNCCIQLMKLLSVLNIDLKILEAIDKK